MDTNEVVYDDPRLGPLPPFWTYSRYYRPDEDDMREYTNKMTGERTDFDPRLTPKELCKRGIKVEEFVLV